MATTSSVNENALSTAVIDRGVMSGTELVARVQRVREVMRDLMEEGVHYGKVPGTQKPSLWKPGAELLLMTFRIGPRLEVEDLTTADEIRYRVKVIGFSQVSGETLAEGIGEASTNEEKYRWRAAVHPKEWEATGADNRRIKFKGNGDEIQQIRTSPADLANTVLLMAVKRGTVNMTRVVTACSDIFDQDLEDLPAELIQAGAGSTPAAADKREVQRASEKNGGTKPTPPVDNGTGMFITSPFKVADVRAVKKGDQVSFYAVTLVGDAKDNGRTREYTTRDQKMASELESFKGTDHLIRVSFKDREYNGKTYHNLEAFALVDAATPVPATTPPGGTKAAEPEQGTLTAADIPFGR
jgi:hypothetical protein